jgi:YggT family protein
VIQVLLCRLLQAYLIIMFARIILSWFPINPGSGMATVYGFLYSITEPVLAPIRRVIPPIGAGGMGLDLSPIVVFIAITILQSAIC